MDKKIPLTPVEQDFKDFYENTGYFTDHVITLSDFTAISENYGEQYRHLTTPVLTPSINSDALFESSYFQRQEDISVIRHIRYMPATTHTHEFFELACVLSGTFTNFIGDQQIELHTGDIFILAPNTPHGICTYEDDGILINILMRASTFEQHFLNLLPDNDILHSFFIKALYKNSVTPYLLFCTGTDPLIQDYIFKIWQEYRRNNRYKNTMLSSLLSIFFVYLLRSHEKNIIIPTIKPSIMNENTIFILEYMQKNYSTITLAHLAKFFNYSERQIHRIIKSTTGMTFGENIKKIRMSHAAKLLSESNMTIQEIADLLGYYDVSSFRKVFKSFYNAPPSSTGKVFSSSAGKVFSNNIGKVFSRRPGLPWIVLKDKWI